MKRADFILPTMTALLMAGCSTNDNSKFDALPTPPANYGTSNSGSGVTDTGAYRLGSGDKLSVNVFGEDRLSGEFVVGEDGSVNLPSLGAVPATGLTVTEFQNDLVTRYASGYVDDPKVSVSVLNSQ
ncbi:MAG: polysaccharide biosynthesis/export family protein [Anderseniella sp.]